VVLARRLEQRHPDVGVRRPAEEAVERDAAEPVHALGDAELGGELLEPEAERGVAVAEEREVRRRHERERAHELLAPAVRGGRALMEDERHVGAEPQRAPQRAAVARRVGQRAHVADHLRRAVEAVALAQPLGDAVGDGDHRIRTRDRVPLDRGDEARPGAAAVRDAGGQLVGVVDQPRAREPRAEQPRREHGGVVRVDDVGPHLHDPGDEPDEERGAVGVEGQRAPQPVGRGGAEPRAAVERPGRAMVELDERDPVPGRGERRGLAPHAGVVDGGLMEQHAYPEPRNGFVCGHESPYDGQERLGL
jgi:hypothetical protein